MAAILLVEDEPTILNSYAFVLTKKGFTVTPVDSAKKALEKVQQEKFDMIVLDMLMPEMSGLDFLKTANPKATMPDTKIIVLSNTESPKIIEEAKQFGATEYFLKIENTPYQLADKVSAVLNT